MKHIVLLLTFFALAFSSVLYCQTMAGDVPTSQLPQGGYVPGELIIRGTPRLTRQHIVSIFREKGIPVTANRLSHYRAYFLVRLTVDDPRSSPRTTRNYESLVDDIICERIAGNPGEGPMSEVEAFWPNYVLDPGNEFVNNTESNNGEEICFPVDLDDYNPLGSCPNHRDIPNPHVGDRRVTVAVMDTGVDYEAFPHFFKDPQTGIPIVHSFPVNETGYLSNDSEGLDVNGHGTAVAALIAHRFYEVQRLKRLNLIDLKILNQDGLGTVAALIGALDLAIEHRVDIINLSLGFVGEECDEYISTLLAPFFTSAEESDILIFTSAGNDGNGLAEYAQYPANSSPSSAKLFTVGASSCADESTWSESNFDVNIVDFTAPGQDIIVPYTKYDECYIKASGTSFATPISASIAAALLTEHSVVRTVCILESRLIPNHGDDQHIPGTNESRLGSISYLGSSYVDECNGDSSGNTPIGSLTIQTGTNAAYPNPVQDVLNVPVSEEEIAANTTIWISDLGGRELYQVPVRNQLVKVSTKELPAGVYILSIVNKDKARVAKFIKR